MKSNEKPMKLQIHLDHIVGYVMNCESDKIIIHGKSRDKLTKRSSNVGDEGSQSRSNEKPLRSRIETDHVVGDGGKDQWYGREHRRLCQRLREEVDIRTVHP